MKKQRFVFNAVCAINREAVAARRVPDCQLRGRWFNPTCHLCFLEVKLKAGGPFYLVSKPGEVKHPTQGVNVYALILEKENFKNQ